MIIQIYIPDYIKHRSRGIQYFFQRMANRLAVGQLRYGDPKASQGYMTRMTVELRAYKKLGNQEQLINIANYCWLETVAPEHPNNHFDPTAESVARVRLPKAKASKLR